MTALGITNAVLAFINLMLASSIIIHGHRNRDEISYVLVTVFSSIWAFGVVFVSANFILPFVVFEWVTLALYIAGDLAYLAFLWFALYYPPSTSKSLLPYTAIIIAHAAFLLTVVLVPSLLFDSLRASGSLVERLTFNGPVYLIYTLLMISAFVWGETVLVKKYKQVNPEDKRLYLNLIGGTLVAGSLGIILNLVLPGLGNFSFFAWGPIFVVFPLFGMSFYLVLKYGFFNLKVIAAELLTFAIWIFVFVRFISETGARARLVDGSLLLLVIIFGVFLVRSVLRETQQKEQLEVLNSELKDLNEHLQEKVDDQTKEIKRAYEVEKKARIDLEEFDKAKDQFILTAQHHLRTPLTIVKGYVESLLGMPPEKTLAESKDYINKAVEGAKRLSSLINELLDISEMRLKQGIALKKSTDIKKLLEGIMSEIEPEAKQKKIETSVEVVGNISADIDPIRFKEALANIFDNAVKYNKEGGSIIVKAEKTIHPIEKDKQMLKISVQDTGIGISKEELPKLFNQYFQRSEAAQKLYATGRGIGLVVTKNIIQAHGGRIWIESEGLNKGSKIFIEIPV